MSFINCRLRLWLHCLYRDAPGVPSKFSVQFSFSIPVPLFLDRLTREMSIWTRAKWAQVWALGANELEQMQGRNPTRGRNPVLSHQFSRELSLCLIKLHVVSQWSPLCISLSLSAQLGNGISCWSSPCPSMTVDSHRRR